MERQRYITDSYTIESLQIDGSGQFSEKDERMVWQQFIEGDNKSLIYIYNKYVDVLYSYGRQHSKNYELIRDCIGELFCDLMDKRSGLSSAQSVKAYLFASLKRRVLKEKRRNGKFLLEEDGFNFTYAEPPLSISGNLKEQDFAIINQKLNLLSVNQREAIYLHFYEGLSYAEIANILKIKIDSVRTLTYRALASLQKHINPYFSSFYALLIFLSQIGKSL
ncbi:MAG: RNA polymerase sigma factor [Bacteroidota bacterium]